MVNNGLDITEEQFLKMGSKERDLIMFRNVTHIRKKLKDYSFHRKLQYVWLFVITVAMGFRRFIGI